MSKFAKGTTVSVEKSRAEIETLLKKHGIADVGIMSYGGVAVVVFRRGAVSYKLTMPALDPTSKQFTHNGWNVLSERQSEAKYQQEERRRWRALGLVLKAKLVAASDGVVTFEQEFLAFALTQDGQTVGERIIPQLETGSLDVMRLALPGVTQ